jgi:hypothetical protein
MNKLDLFLGIAGYLPKNLEGGTFNFINENFQKYMESIEHIIKKVLPVYNTIDNTSYMLRRN